MLVAEIYVVLNSLYNLLNVTVILMLHDSFIYKHIVTYQWVYINLTIALINSIPLYCHNS